MAAKHRVLLPLPAKHRARLVVVAKHRVCLVVATKHRVLLLVAATHRVYIIIHYRGSSEDPQDPGSGRTGLGGGGRHDQNV